LAATKLEVSSASLNVVGTRRFARGSRARFFGSYRGLLRLDASIRKYLRDIDHGATL
jgi:hypothetical protein